MKSEFLVYRRYQQMLAFCKSRNANTVLEYVIIGLAVAAVAIAFLNSCYGLFMQDYIAKIL